MSKLPVGTVVNCCSLDVDKYHFDRAVHIGMSRFVRVLEDEGDVKDTGKKAVVHELLDTREWYLTKEEAAARQVASLEKCRQDESEMLERLRREVGLCDTEDTQTPSE